MVRTPRYDLFVSYAEADLAWVKGYLLPALGLPADRVITPQNFHPGATLVGEFERAVADSRYTVLVLSPAYSADQWAVFGELLTSHASVAERRDRLVPLLLQSCELPLRVEFRVRLDCTDEAEWEGAAARLRELLGTPDPPPERIPCPYPGMVPFEEADSGRFYGRDVEVRELVQRVRLHHFVAVISASGTGKSSLVSAGLIPALRASGLFGEGGWSVRRLRTGRAPLLALSEALGADPYTQVGARGAVDEALARDAMATRLLLMVDQFEALFAGAVANEETEAFQQALLALAQDPRCWVVVLARADFYQDLMRGPLWPYVKANRLELAPAAEGRGRRDVAGTCRGAGGTARGHRGAVARPGGARRSSAAKRCHAGRVRIDARPLIR